MSKYKHITVGYECTDSKGNKGVVIEDLGFNCSVKFEDGTIRKPVPKSKIVSGKFRKDLPDKLAKIDIPIGERFGNLTVTGYDGARLEMSCDCGKDCTTSRYSVVKLGKVSCGCLAMSTTEQKYWENFNYRMSKWNPNTHRTDVKKLPLFQYRRGSTDIVGIKAFTYVDSDFYEQFKHIPFMKAGKYAGISSSKYVRKLLCKSPKLIREMPNYKVHHLVKGHTKVGQYVVDHINSNGLDNRHKNLRTATITENSRNTGKKNKNNSSIYKGVCLIRNHKWQATLRVGNKSYTKSCKTEVDAALAYNQLALEYYGDFARLNKIS